MLRLNDLQSGNHSDLIDSLRGGQPYIGRKKEKLLFPGWQNFLDRTTSYVMTLSGVLSKTVVSMCGKLQDLSHKMGRDFSS